MAEINKEKKKGKQLPVLSPKEEALVQETIEDVFTSDSGEALIIIEAKLRNLDPQEIGAAFEWLQIALQSMWQFFEAIRLVRKNVDWVNAHELLLSAADGFNSIGIRELFDLCIGIGSYSEAIIEIQKSNIGKALELLSDVKKYLDNAGQFGSKFRPLIDHIEPDALYLAGVKALMELDFGNGKILIEQASQSAERVALEYYEEGTPLYNTFQGLARFHRAYYTYNRAYNDFNLYDFDSIIAKKGLAEDAIQARELLSRGDLQNELIRNTVNTSNALVDLLMAIHELAQLMNNIFQSTLKLETSALISVKQRIATASDSAAKSGSQAVIFVRACNLLSDRVKNIERLAKPTKKDFGTLSGLVASATFLPLFLIVSWSNTTFSTGLNATTLITSCIILALIAGFGFGALRFKSLVFPTHNGKDYPKSHKQK